MVPNRLSEAHRYLFLSVIGKETLGKEKGHYRKLAKKENIEKRKKKRRGGNFGEWTHQNAVLMP